jgi:hypothetical protein
MPGRNGYTLQANVKTREGPQHPDRDAQFRYLNRQVKSFRRSGDFRGHEEERVAGSL